MAKFCKGTTIHNVQCKNKVSCGNYCYHHKKQEAVPKRVEHEDPIEEECTICTDVKDSDMFIKFSCSHSICKECVNKLEKHACPFCRKDISGEIPEELKKSPAE